MVRFYLVLVALLLLIPSHSPIMAKFKKQAVTITIKTSPHSQYESKSVLQSKELVNFLLQKNLLDEDAVPPITDTYISFKQKGKRETYLVSQNYRVFDVTSEKFLKPLPNKIEKEIMTLIDTLKKKHYGELLPWNKVTEIIPKKSTFEILDIDSGLRFKVQRRAGSQHADVQPLTKKDTEIMKEIYNGKWSWKRRAILINVNKQSIAASMHGMPHGKGALVNGFPGHFCVHLQGSTTHKSKSTDLSQQLMVLKAAGTLDQYFYQIGSSELVDVFLAAVNQHDLYLLTHSVGQEKDFEKIAKELFTIESIRKVAVLGVDETNNFINEIPIEVRFYRHGQREEKQSLIFRVYRNSLVDRWEIDFQHISKQLIK